MERRMRMAIVGVTLVIAAGGCVTPRPPAPAPPTPPRAQPSPRSESRIALARSLIGSTYRYGGDGPGEFDCSGLVHYVFDYEGVVLPRTTREQARAGAWVPLDELERGDLVFFSEGGAEPHHVGLVVSGLGESLRMIHASTSEGVVETDLLASRYWLRRLRFGRRMAAPSRR